MKRLIIILSIVLFSCETNSVKEADKKIQTSSRNIQVNINNGQIYVVEIDSCEYVRFDRGIAHKGNCKYCLNRK